MIRTLGLIPFLLFTGCSWFKTPVVQEPVQKVSADTIRVFKEALENLQTQKVQTTPFPNLLSLMGKISVTEDRTTIVPARVQGRIEAIYFASGEHVRKGDLLASIFSPDFISAREEYLLSLKQSVANGKTGADPSDFANLAQMSRKKLESLGLSAEDIEALPSSAANETNKVLLSVRAPREGVLIQKAAILGGLVNLGDSLFVIGDLSRVWFSGDIYPEDLPKVHKGQDVFINAVGVEKPLYGKVSFISPLVDPVTRSIKIRALMENPNRALKADEYVQGNVVVEKTSALVIPANAIVRTPEGPVVYLQLGTLPPEASAAILEHKKIESFVDSLDFKRVPIVLGKEQSGQVAILSGLKEGDIVVSEGGLLLDAALNNSQLTN